MMTEVDRVADLDPISSRFRPLQQGEVVRVAGDDGPDEKLQSRYDRWIDAPSCWHGGVASV